jgi:hypothetical protein
MDARAAGFVLRRLRVTFFFFVFRFAIAVRRPRAKAFNCFCVIFFLPAIFITLDNGTQCIGLRLRGIVHALPLCRRGLAVLIDKRANQSQVPAPRGQHFRRVFHRKKRPINDLN